MPLARNRPVLCAPHLPLTLALACLVLACTAGPAQAGSVDGVSDQSLATEWVGSVPSSQIRYARLVVPWDVMAPGSGETVHFGLLRSWLADVKSLGLVPDVAVEQAEVEVASDGESLPRVPASPVLYRRYVSALLSYAASVGEPISYLEAWNEPNNVGLGTAGVGHPSARTAAEYMNAATALCAEDGCKPIAGDFLDADFRWAGHPEVHEGATGMGAAYEREYDSFLDPVNPPVWGFHPYAAVKYETTEAIAEFRGALPDPDDSIWFTEVGVYECKAGQVTGGGGGAGEQEGGARYLSRLIADDFSVAHTFYYELKSPSEEQEERCSGGEDTSLYNYRGEARGAAQILFGAAASPAVQGASADDGLGPLAGVAGDLWGP
jgi:hypothetical protein